MAPANRILRLSQILRERRVRVGGGRGGQSQQRHRLVVELRDRFVDRVRIVGLHRPAEANGRGATGRALRVVVGV